MDSLSRSGADTVGAYEAAAARPKTVVALSVLALALVLLAAILLRNGGHFSYTLDAPYTQMAMAEQITRGTYGINPGEPSSPSSSIIYPFLLALLFVNRFVDLLKVITAFTVAHTLTLALSVLQIVKLPPPLVEIGIAMTIMYVAGENLWLRDTSGRWLLTFGFGLVHGFGFASVLRELGLPSGGMARSLLSFNLGVELGQIAIVGLARSGKTTVFNALTRGEARTGGFGAVEVNTGVVKVPDLRLTRLTDLLAEAVPDVDGEQAGERIEVALAVDVLEVAAVTADDDRHLAVHVAGHAGEVQPQVVAGGLL